MEINIDMIGYRDGLEKYFTQLNIVWLQKYFVVEPIDHEMLSDPKKYIIEKGGFIYFADFSGEITGIFALIKIAEGVYELSKMAVEESFKGKGVGNKMLEFCLDEAKRLEANKIILYSNTKLESAIHLYKKFGFKEVPLDNPDYERANIKMELKVK